MMIREGGRKGKGFAGVAVEGEILSCAGTRGVQQKIILKWGRCCAVGTRRFRVGGVAASHLLELRGEELAGQADLNGGRELVAREDPNLAPSLQG